MAQESGEPALGWHKQQSEAGRPPRAVIYGKYGGWLRGLFIQRFGPAHLDGLRIGRSDAVLLRLLHLFSIDCTGTPWFQRGEPPPMVQLPSNIAMRWLSYEEWQASPRLLNDPAEVAERKYKAGARCLIARDNNAKCTPYQLWATEEGAYISWIFRYVAAPRGHLLVFNAWVHPDYRGGNLHWAGMSEAIAEAVRGGRQFFAGMEEVEYFPFAAKIMRLGLGICEPHSKILGLKLFSKNFHLAGGPSPLLVEFAERLRILNRNQLGLKSDSMSESG